MNVHEAVAARTSIRAFLPTPVDADAIARVFDRARYAPSGGNVRPRQPVVVAGEPVAAPVHHGSGAPGPRTSGLFQSAA